jgi:hypothetical protein
MANAALLVRWLLRSVILELLVKVYGCHQHVAEQKLWRAQAKDDPALPDPIPYQYYDEHGKLHEGKVAYQRLRFGRNGPRINQAYPLAKIPPAKIPPSAISPQRCVIRNAWLHGDYSSDGAGKVANPKSVADRMHPLLVGRAEDCAEEKELSATAAAIETYEQRPSRPARVGGSYRWAAKGAQSRIPSSPHLGTPLSRVC